MLERGVSSALVCKRAAENVRVLGRSAMISRAATAMAHSMFGLQQLYKNDTVCRFLCKHIVHVLNLFPNSCQRPCLYKSEIFTLLPDFINRTSPLRMADSYYQGQYSAPPPSQGQYYASEAQHHYPGQDSPRYGSSGYYPPEPQVPAFLLNGKEARDI
jgi:hypothetical protein